MLDTLKKAKQLTVIALDRLSDYMALLRIEMKLQGREIALQLLGYAAAALLSVYAMLFIGVAIIVSFWDSEYRALAAWGVVALYIAGASAGLSLARHHAARSEGLASLREELRRDAELIRESL